MVSKMQKKAKKDQVGLRERALIKRVNRFLADSGRKLLKNRSTRSDKGQLTKNEKALGVFYIVDGVTEWNRRGDKVVERHVDLEDFARQIEVMATYEVLAAE